MQCERAEGQRGYIRSESESDQTLWTLLGIALFQTSSKAAQDAAPGNQLALRHSFFDPPLCLKISPHFALEAGKIANAIGGISFYRG